MDVAEQNSILRAGWGPDQAAHRPASWDLALFNGDPTQDGVEVSGGGYVRQTIDAGDWSTPVAGQMAAAWVEFPAPSGAWSPSTATHWALYDGTTLGASGPLADGGVTVESANPAGGPKVQVVLAVGDRYDALDEDA